MSERSAPGAHANGDQPVLIELDHVVKTFKNAAGEFFALKGIDAVFYQGQFVSVVGRSGSGKSTLLNMITGIDHPTSGEVRVGNTLLYRLDESRMSVWRGKQMGIVFQFFQLLPMLTLLENVMLPMDFADLYPPAEREPRAMGLLKMVGLEGLEYKYPAAVSGGQQQTAAVARALANDPPILVADEPTGNLDTRTAERVLEIFEEQVALSKTVVMVTHDNSLAEHAFRKLVISDGELVNESFSRAFPQMRHGTLLRLSHAAKLCHFAPGETLLDPGSPALVLIVAGEADVVTTPRPLDRGPFFRKDRAPRLDNPEVSGRLGPGALFSQAHARALGRAFAGLKAHDALDAWVVETLPEAPDLPAALEEAAAASRDHRGEKGGQ